MGVAYNYYLTNTLESYKDKDNNIGVNLDTILVKKNKNNTYPITYRLYNTGTRPYRFYPPKLKKEHIEVYGSVRLIHRIFTSDPTKVTENYHRLSFQQIQYKAYLNSFSWIRAEDEINQTDYSTDDTNVILRLEHFINYSYIMFVQYQDDFKEIKYIKMSF